MIKRYLNHFQVPTTSILRILNSKPPVETSQSVSEDTSYREYAVCCPVIVVEFYLQLPKFQHHLSSLEF